ncbi:hypothetical protein LSH36_1567g00017 [Paralvinella palmiformis]|uniref:Uncharacterized protein n=1 Tax=Paralvinella palmiformis TaxID=53620 RepID=A0AAD9MR25_9ANNE|nr:hypothetical protein LSH36_1567g00017 [Paralvinella palmiformis]
MGCLYPVSWSFTVEGLVLFLLTTLVYVIIVCVVFHQTSRLRPVWPLQQLRKNAICAISACVPNEHHIASRHPPPVPDGRASSQRITLTTNKPLDDVIRFSFSMLAHDDEETDDSRSQPDSSVNVSRSGLNEEVTVDTSPGVPGCQIAVDGSYQTADEEESLSGKGETVDNHVCDVSCTPDDGNEVCGQGPGVGSHNLDMFLASSERASRAKRSKDSRCNLDWSRSRASLDVTMDGRLSEGSVGLQYLAAKNRLGPLSAQPSAPSNTELIGHFDRNRIVEGMTFQPPWRRTRQSAHRTLRDDSYASSTDEARTRPSGSRSSVFGNDPSMTNFYSPSRSGDDKTHRLALHHSTLPRQVGGRGPYWRVGTNLMKRVAVILAVVTWFTLPQIAFVFSIPHLELDVASCLYPFVNVVHRSSFLAVPHVYSIGEVFVHCEQTNASSMLEATKELLQKEIKKMEVRSEEHKSVLSELKVQLYAKFGNNINLEAEDD